MDTLKKEQNLRATALWQPQPRQELALSRPEFEIGFGGARGGGKTDAGLSWLLYDSDVAALTGIVLRKNSIDLGEWILRARRRFENDRVGATITGNPPVINFRGKPDPANPGRYLKGATYFLGHFKDDKAFTKYQGQELPRMLLEELELIPSEESYEALLASCRSTVPGVKAQAFSTFNPGGPGHTWIKKRFGLSGIPTKPVITKDARTGRMRIFIPARVEDNQSLMTNDPDYVHFLEGLPDGLREQWRWGSWDNPIIKGAYYTLELEEARRNNRIAEWPHFKEYGVHTWWDIGRDMTSIGFFQFVDGWWYLIDYYQNDSRGLSFYLTKLQELSLTKGYRYATHHFPHDIEHTDWGSDRTRLEVIENAKLDYEIVPKLSIDDGIEAVRLIFPRLRIDQRNCAALVDGLVNYRHEWDAEKQVFKPAPMHDWASHPSDMVRYFAVSNHGNIAGRKKKLELPPAQRGMGPKAPPVEEEEGYESSPEFGGGQPAGGSGRFHY